MKNAKFRKYVIAALVLVMIVPVLLTGCKNSRKTEEPEQEIIYEYVTETPVPGSDATTDPNAGITTDDPNAGIPTEDPSGVVPTEDPSGVVPTQDPGAGITTPTTNTGALTTPTKPTTTSKTTPKPSDSTKPSDSKLLTAYKDVAIIGAYMATIMSPFTFSNRWDATKGDIVGAYDKQNFFGFDRGMYRPFYSGKQKTEGARYFELPLTGMDLFNDAKYVEYQRQGAFPFMAVGTNKADELNVSNFPKDLKKIYFDNWALDKYDDVRNSEGPSKKWTNDVVIPDLKKAINKVKAQCPNATIYIGGVLPWIKEIPRIAPEYPDSYETNKDMSPGSLYYTMKNLDTPAKFKECNDALKKFATDNGYKFVDFLKTSLVDAQGYRKSEYAHYMDIGEFPSRSCMRIYGDTIMNAMGLPVAPKLT